MGELATTLLEPVRLRFLRAGDGYPDGHAPVAAPGGPGVAGLALVLDPRRGDEAEALFLERLDAPVLAAEQAADLALLLVANSPRPAAARRTDARPCR